MTHSHPRRNFTPSKTARYGRGKTLPVDVLIKYSPKWQYSRLMNFPFQGSHFRPRMRSLVISVGGSSRGNHDPNIRSRSAWGVFFGPVCAFNTYGVDLSGKVKSGGAELMAVQLALKTVLARRRAGEIEGYREIIIKLDSEYVANTFDEWIWAWADQGWVRNNGQPIKNLNLVKAIHYTISSMEIDGMAVRFWRVARECNDEAHQLAKDALDNSSDSGYSGV